MKREHNIIFNSMEQINVFKNSISHAKLQKDLDQWEQAEKQRIRGANRKINSNRKNQIKKVHDWKQLPTILNITVETQSNQLRIEIREEERTRKKKQKKHRTHENSQIFISKKLMRIHILGHAQFLSKTKTEKYYFGGAKRRTEKRKKKKKQNSKVLNGKYSFSHPLPWRRQQSEQFLRYHKIRSSISVELICSWKN